MIRLQGPGGGAHREAGAGSRSALLVGVDAYAHGAGFQAPASASANVEALRRLLAEQEDAHFEVETLVNPEKTSLMKSLQKVFKDASPNDTVLLYYCGTPSSPRGATSTCAPTTPSWTTWMPPRSPWSGSPSGPSTRAGPRSW
jgi:hypothetical protein